MFKHTIFATSLCLFFILTGCTKSTQDKQWHAEITENKAATLQDVFLQNGSEKLIDIVASNDVVKMSNYNKGEWNIKWDNLYHHFIKKNKAKLYKFRYYFPSL